jgi:hypothetical protein
MFTSEFLPPLSNQIPQKVTALEAAIPLSPAPPGRLPQDDLVALYSHCQAGALPQPQLVTDVFGESHLSSRRYTGFQHARIRLILA